VNAHVRGRECGHREYWPDEGVARYHWPGQIWERSLAKLGTDSSKLRLGAV
jgi:hypothetical protein